MPFGLAGLVFLIFLVLKLASIGVVATWSWWAVTSPLWISAAFTAFWLLVIFVLAVVVGDKR